MGISSLLGSQDGDYKALLALSVFQPNVELLQGLLDEAVTAALRLVRADGGKIWLYAGERLRAASIVNLDARYLREFTPRSGEGLSGLCLQHKAPMVSSDVLADSRAARPEIARKLNMRGFVAVPLSVGSRTIGVLSIQSSSPRTFTDGEVQALARYARRTGLIVHHCTFFPEMSAEWVEQMRSEERGDWPAPAGQLDYAKSQIFPRHLPKTIHLSTLDLVYGVLQRSDGTLTCDEAAGATNLSVVTVRRYLSYLVELNLVCRKSGYGQRGRPKFLYVLNKPPEPQDDPLQRRGV